MVMLQGQAHHGAWEFVSRVLSGFAWMMLSVGDGEAWSKQ